MLRKAVSRSETCSLVKRQEDDAINGLTPKASPPFVITELPSREGLRLATPQDTVYASEEVRYAFLIHESLWCAFK